MNRLSLSISAAIGIVCAVSLAPLTAANADDAAAILARHRAFMGWTGGDGSVTSWRTTEVFRSQTSGTSETDTDRVVVTTLQRGLQYHETTVHESNAFVESEQGFTGRVFWDADENGYVVTVLGDRARFDIAENALSADTLATLPGTSRGTSKIGDDRVDVVRVTPNLSFPVDLYIDSTGAYRRVVINPDARTGRRETINVQKYVDAVPGKKFVAAYSYGADRTIEVTKVEVNVPISDDDLRPPQPRAHWTFASVDPTPIDIITYTGQITAYGGAVRVRASINGHEGTFLLDSGSFGILVFDPFAATLDLPALGPSSYVGVMAGETKATRVLVKELTVGKNVLRNVVVHRSRGDSGIGTDGVLGYDFLAGALVDVDLGAKTLRILDPKQYAPEIAKGTYAFPVDLTERSPAVAATVGNGVAFEPTLDTGNSFDVLISDTLRTSGKVVTVADEVNKGAYTMTDTMSYRGPDGETVVPCVRLNKMSVGPYRFEASHACFASPDYFGDDGGLVGYDFLKHFNWIFDYPDGKVVLTPNGQ